MKKLCWICLTLLTAAALTVFAAADLILDPTVQHQTSAAADLHVLWRLMPLLGVVLAVAVFAHKAHK